MSVPITAVGLRTRRPRAAQTLRAHWPEYLIEAWGLGVFMLSAGLVVMLLEYPGSALHALLPDATLRRALTGLMMGLTAVGIIYSPWGQRSGAHLNPAVTLSFLRLGKITGWDALFYILAQFGGGTLGVLALALLFGTAFTAAPVAFVATTPGTAGTAVAAAAEFIISMILMLSVLTVANSTRWARLTGVCAGMLVAVFIAVEAPLSGMSMNPARSFASAAPAGHWAHLWLYVVAPVAGMLGAVEFYRRGRTTPLRCCAKLDHPEHQRCIHCGFEPAPVGDRKRQ